MPSRSHLIPRSLILVGSTSLLVMAACAGDEPADEEVRPHRLTIVLEGDGRVLFDDGTFCERTGPCAEVEMEEGGRLEGSVVRLDYRGWQLTDDDADRIVAEDVSANIAIDYEDLGSSSVDATLVVRFGAENGSGGSGGAGSGSGDGGSGGAAPSPSCEHTVSTEAEQPNELLNRFFPSAANCPMDRPSSGTTCDVTRAAYCGYASSVTDYFWSCGCTGSGDAMAFACANTCPTCINQGDPCLVSGDVCAYPSGGDTSTYICDAGAWRRTTTR